MVEFLTHETYDFTENVVRLESSIFYPNYKLSEKL